MASSTQVRAWWSAYRCNPSKMVRVAFPGPAGITWNLLVADRSAPIWQAVAQIMASEPYLFRESAGGTYNCRPPSLHAYGLAFDLNPSKNPFRFPMVTDMPDSFIARMEGIRANGKQAIMWGGRFPDSNPPDPMHYQINVAPADVKNITWDKGLPTVEDSMYAPVEEGDTGVAVEAWQRVLQRISGFAPKAWGKFEADTTAELQRLTGPGTNIGPSEGAVLLDLLGASDSGGLTEAQVKAIVNSAVVHVD